MTQHHPRHPRRAAACALAALVLAPAYSYAQRDGYPARPVRLILPYPPGGGNDIIGRALVERLSPRLGQQIVVDNRGGAATAIGAELAARSPADGYTIFLATASTLSVNPNVKAKLPYDPVKDFDPISTIAVQPYLLVLHPGVAAKHVRELISLAKQKPGVLNFSSPGAMSNGHLAGEMLRTMTQTDMVHVPYKGTGPAVVDLMAGQISFMFATVPSVISHHRSGKLRGIAVSGAKRSGVLPEIPTVAEAGVPGYDIVTWNAIMTPRGVSPAIRERLVKEITASVEDPAFKSRLISQGAEPDSSTPEELAARIKSELARYAKLVRSAGLITN